MPIGVTVATPSIGDLIESNGVTAHFQPIVSARQRSVMGFEALARGANGRSSSLTAATLFRMAADASLTSTLERLCCEVSIQRFSALTRSRPDLILFLNLGSWVGADPSACVDELNHFVERAHLSPHRIAIEILETESESLARLVAVSDGLRASGFLLALDDVGVGHSNLDRIALVKPDVVKVDRGLITGIDGDFFKQEALNCLSSLCRKIGALVVAEGVETAEEAIVSLELGADLLQGFFFAPATPDGALTRDNGTVADIEMLAHAFKRHMMGKVEHRRSQQRQLTTVMDSLLSRLSLADAGEFESLLQDASSEHQDVECVYVLDGAGTQMTPTIVAKYLLQPRRNPLSAGAQRGRPFPQGLLLRPSRGGFGSLHVRPVRVPGERPLVQDPQVPAFKDRRAESYVLCIDVLC